MELNDMLISAKQAVEKADLPSEFQLKAFEMSFNYLAGFHSENDIKNSNGINNQNMSSPNGGVKDGSVLSKIAFKLKIDISKIEEIYFMDEGELKIIIGTSKLDNSVAGATKQLALLVGGGRQLGELEAWTSTDLISTQCEYFGKYDSSNFAKTIKSMDNYFSYTGSSHDRKIKIIRPGIDSLNDLILKLTS